MRGMITFAIQVGHQSLFLFSKPLIATMLPLIKTNAKLQR
jgi:hypothetical protein